MRLAREPRRARHLRGDAAPSAVSTQGVRDLGAGAGQSAAARRTRLRRAARRRARRHDRRVRDRSRAAHRAEKSGAAADVAPGFSGLEIALGAYAQALPDLPLARFVELLSTNPARILGVAGGSLDAARRPTSRSSPSARGPSIRPLPSKGKTRRLRAGRFPRQALATIVGGVLRYRAREIARDDGLKP